jgi:hypothetical protein
MPPNTHQWFYVAGDMSFISVSFFSRSMRAYLHGVISDNRLLNENPMFNMIKEPKSFMKHLHDDVCVLLACFLLVVVMIISLSLSQGISRTMILISENIWNRPESSGICPADTGKIRKYSDPEYCFHEIFGIPRI